MLWNKNNIEKLESDFSVNTTNWSPIIMFLMILNSKHFHHLMYTVNEELAES